jgi:hypothetical protein
MWSTLDGTPLWARRCFRRRPAVANGAEENPIDKVPAIDAAYCAEGLLLSGH